MAELVEVKGRNNINYIIFQDEIISYQSEWLKEFVPLYKERIGIPFTAYAFPSENFKERMKLLKEAGLSSTCVAVQSASPRICKIYNRHYERELFLEAANILRSMNLTFYTDVITYNPLEKREDLEYTLKFLLDLPQPYDICVNKLYILPGTELSKELKGIEPDRDASGISKDANRIFDYYSRLFWLASYFKNSATVINFIKSIRIFERYPVLLKPVLYIFFVLGSLNKGIYRFKKIRRSGRLNLRFIIDFLKRKSPFLNRRGLDVSVR